MSNGTFCPFTGTMKPFHQDDPDSVNWGFVSCDPECHLFIDAEKLTAAERVAHPFPSMCAIKALPIQQGVTNSLLRKALHQAMVHLNTNHRTP